MGDIGKVQRKITLVPMPDDVPAPEIVPEPVREPEPAREPARVGVLHRSYRLLDGTRVEQDIDLIPMGGEVVR